MHRDIRDYFWDGPAKGLCFGAEIPKLATKKSAGVVKKVGGWCKHLNITGPTESFVALRTVYWKRNEVATRLPDDIAMQLIDLLMGGLEGFSPTHIARENHRGEVLLSDVCASDLDVSKAV